MKKDVQSNSFSTSNIVGIVKISDNLDLKKIYMGLENTSYEPEQFSGLVYRNDEPPGTLTVFKSGKILCTGMKDSKHVGEVVGKFVKELDALGIPVIESYKVQIKNMVFTRTLNTKINLAKVALSFGLENVDYEPDEFPGLIFRIEEPKVTFILFESGKIICTGTESKASAKEAFTLLEKKLKRFKII